MYNKLRGEMKIDYDGITLILCPTIENLIAIEQRLGNDIVTLFSHWNKRGIFSSEAMVVAKCCYSTPKKSGTKLPFHRRNFIQTLKTVIPFFIQETLGAHINDNTKLSPIKWQQMFRIAVAYWHIAPQDFWKMSLIEYRLLTQLYEQTSFHINKNDVQIIVNALHEEKNNEEQINHGI